jgi:dihydropteroate synthase
VTGIWGIVNVTPDSFSDGGRYLAVDNAVAHGLRLRAEGAAVLDIGGESTRPGAERVEQLVAAGVPVSVDTLNASTASAAVRAGARIVNDVSGGLADPEMLSAVAESGADYAIGHWRGFSADMYAKAAYRRAAREVAGELQDRIGEAAAAGIAPSRLIVDPGIGFAKAGAQNWDVLRGLGEITGLGHRVLVGTSRKRFLTETLSHGGDADVTESRRDLATAVTSALALRAGVWAVRVHDVASTRDALAIAAAWEG